MKALELYNAVFDSANNMISDEEKNTVHFIQDYAEGAFNSSVSTETAKLILDCHIDFSNNGQGSNDFYYMVEAKLEDIII